MLSDPLGQFLKHKAQFLPSRLCYGMILQILGKYPLLLITPIFAAFDHRSFVVISPFTYFIDLVNYCLGKPSAFGSFGVWIDLAALCLSTLILFAVLFKGHAILFRKRFST